MKTSTKNTIIGGIFTICAAIVGTTSFSLGKNSQNEKMETKINQSGIILSDKDENAFETMERMFNEYINLQEEYNKLFADLSELKNNYDTIVNKNNELINKINVLENKDTSASNFNEQKEENIISKEVIKEKYLFDEDPYMVENVNLYMRNNDRNTIFRSNSFSYEPGFHMCSNNVEYQKGMAITPKSSQQASLYYNLEKKYSSLSGMAAFEDKYSDRADKNYRIYLYCDNDLADTINIVKGELPKEFNISVTGYSILHIVLERAEGDRSDNPNINLIEWKLN